MAGGWATGTDCEWPSSIWGQYDGIHANAYDTIEPGHNVPVQPELPARTTGTPCTKGRQGLGHLPPEQSIQTEAPAVLVGLAPIQKTWGSGTGRPQICDFGFTTDYHKSGKEKPGEGAVVVRERERERER